MQNHLGRPHSPLKRERNEKQCYSLFHFLFNKICVGLFANLPCNKNTIKCIHILRH